MKRSTIAVVILLLLTASGVWARSIRDKFPARRTNVVLKGEMTVGASVSGGKDPITYVLRARKGQRMSLHLVSARKNAVLGVYRPGMNLIEGALSVKDWSGTLPESGDYQIMVFPDDEMTNTSFTLEITIR